MDKQVPKTDALPSGIDEAHYSEFTYLKRLNLFMVIIGAPVVLFYAIVNYRDGNYLESLLFCVMFLNVVIGIVSLKRLTSFKRLVKAKMICGAIGFFLVSAALLNGIAHIDLYRFMPWIFLSPMIVVLFFGDRWGFYGATAFCLASTIVIYKIKSPFPNGRHEIMFVVNSVLVMIFILIVTNIAEKTRRQVQHNLLAMQNKYKQAEQKQRQANAELAREINLRIAFEKELSQSELRYRALFEESSISLWEEDWSLLKRFLDELPQEAADDLTGYLKNDQEVLRYCLSLIKVTAVNRATLTLFEADSTDMLLNNLNALLTGETRGYLIQRIVSLYRYGQYRAKGAARTINGNPRRFFASSSVPVGCEQSWQRIFTSVYDISDQDADGLRVLSNNKSRPVIVHSL